MTIGYVYFIQSLYSVVFQFLFLTSFIYCLAWIIPDLREYIVFPKATDRISHMKAAHLSHTGKYW